MDARSISPPPRSLTSQVPGGPALLCGLLLLTALACTDPSGTLTSVGMDDHVLHLDEVKGHTGFEGTVLFDFETYPDGSVPCGGAGQCSLSNEYESLGLTFSAENGHSSCGPGHVWLTRTTHAYDPPESQFNRAASNSCSTGSFWVSLDARPKTVEFEIWMNDDVDIEIEAYRKNGRPLPSGSVVREAQRYTSRFGFTFRRERVRISTPSGVARFGWETDFFGVLLDNIRFQPRGRGAAPRSTDLR